MFSMGSLVSLMRMYDGTSTLKDELDNEAQYCLNGRQALTYPPSKWMMIRLQQFRFESTYAKVK